MNRLLCLILTVALSGCSGANISSHIRESNDNNNMMTRCTQFESTTDGNMNEDLEAYDGWKMIYVSEYTTTNKVNTSIVMCFEKEQISQKLPPHLTSIYR
ncbi:hypothetical protein MD588_22765 [Photobacterium sp. SDRW27]|uniref:hypothetical protein n=1 Tax=Photobacterium obscurum TaxID=2829490 RepID=UPI002243EB3B|nr:hypothetical protein [Photobacterium obscurum]MCW8331625.1 hypothetical protein [Photobacterium obscurum]